MFACSQYRYFFIFTAWYRATLQGPSCYATFVTVYRDRVMGSTEKYAPLRASFRRELTSLLAPKRVPRGSSPLETINPRFDGEIYALMRPRWKEHCCRYISTSPIKWWYRNDFWGELRAYWEGRRGSECVEALGTYFIWDLGGLSVKLKLREKNKDVESF